MDTRSQPSGPVSRISTPRSSRPCQTACRSANVPNSTKFASESAACRPDSAQPVDGAVALGPQLVDRGQQLVGVRQRHPGHGLRHRGQVVGQPDDAHRVDDRRRRGEVAEPAAGQRERLGHRAGDDQPRRGRQQATARSARRRGGTRRRPRRPPPSPGAAATIASTSASGSAVPVGLFGEASSTTDGWCSASTSSACGRSMAKSSARRPSDPVGVGVAGVLRIHRVGRRERHRGAARAAEGLQQLQHDLVRAVGRPHLLGVERHARRRPLR